MANKSRVNALRSYLVYVQRQKESNTATLKRVAQFLGVSDSTLRRALKRDRVTDYLWDKVTRAIRLEPSSRQASIYYGARMLDRSRGSTRERRLEKFRKSYSSLRKDIKKYKHRINKNLRRDDRLLASNLKIPIRVIRLYTDTP